MNPYILLILGYLLIFIEFYIPGAIMGVLGGVSIFISILLFISQNDSFLFIFAYILAVLLGLGLLFKFALWRIKHAKPEYSIYSDANQHGYKASKFDTHLIGKTATVLSDLKPGGYISIEGEQCQAISESGYIAKGESVLIVGGQEESLIVRKI
ncbi:MAG TPA: NfeD family protein [Parachlamydiaceae bacterium]|nr:NfeD family protein [Parachlamydiaceae bacterium]